MSRTYKDAPKQRAARREAQKRRALSARSARRSTDVDRKLGQVAIALALSEVAASETNTAPQQQAGPHD